MRGLKVGAGAPETVLVPQRRRPDHGHPAIDDVDQVAAGPVAVVGVAGAVDEFLAGAERARPAPRLGRCRLGPSGG